jgi:hypothetical protein
METHTQYFKFIFLLICINLLYISCRSDREAQLVRMEDDLPELSSLITTVNNNYASQLKIPFKNRLVFSNDNERGFKSSDFVADEAISNKMEELNIQEIRFEKNDNICNENYGFTEVYFKLNKIFTLKHLIIYSHIAATSKNIFLQPYPIYL